MSKKEKAGLVGMFTAVTGGAWVILSGLLNPSWLVAHTGLWYPISTTLASFVGPRILPGVPWGLLLLVASLAFIASLLIKAYHNRTTQA